jgi:6-phosphogluconolactonase
MNNQPEPFTVYIGTYTRRESFVDGKAEGVYVYRMDPRSGALTHAATVPGTVNPSFLVVSAGKDYLYAVNELTGEHGTHGTVSAFAIDPATKSLTYLNKQSTHGFAPCYLSIDDTGQFVLVANYESGSLCVLPIEADGRLGEATDVVQHHGSGPNAERQEGPHAHMILPGADRRTIFAVDLGIDKLLAYDLDRQHGKLLAIDSAVTKLAPGTGPRHLAFHPDGKFAYVISELQSSVIVFRLGARRGTLEETLAPRSRLLRPGGLCTPPIGGMTASLSLQWIRQGARCRSWATYLLRASVRVISPSIRRRRFSWRPTRTATRSSPFESIRRPVI